MPKKLFITVFTFLLVGVLTFVVVWATNQQEVALPEAITEATLCPVAGCTQQDGACHAANPAPEPDGSFEMNCPKVEGCSDVQCHAWERIDSTSMRPSDSSLNLWILAPAVLVLFLMWIARKI